MESILLGTIVLMLGFIYKVLVEIKTLLKYNHNEPNDNNDNNDDIY